MINLNTHSNKYVLLLIPISVPIYFLIIILNLTLPLNAEEKDQPIEPTETDNNKKVALPAVLPFSINNQLLIENVENDSNITQSKLESTKDGELLILKHHSKSSKKRGNVLLLHTNGENANHQRLVRPLSIQLSHLGWNVYIPNIAMENFPKPRFGTARKIYSNYHKSKTMEEPLENQAKTEVSGTGSSSDTNKIQTEQDNTPEIQQSDIDESESAPLLNEKKYYFNSPNKYQTYIKELCEKISTDPEWSEQPRILILIQSSGYWGLNCFPETNTPTIFLDPQIPIGVSNDLEQRFKEQSSSFYVFYSELTENTEMASFAKALSSNQWRSKNQRYNQGILTKGNLNIEDVRLAKRITGWAEILRKKTIR